jgi:hypothetical protein
MSNKEYEIRFAPGAFDEFEGTQEELDELMEEIKSLAASGTLHEISHPVDMDQLQEEDPELYETLTRQLEQINKRLN